MTARLTVFIFLFILFNLRSVSSASLDLNKYSNYDYDDGTVDVNVNNDTKYDSLNDKDYVSEELDDDHDDYDNFNYNKYNDDIDSNGFTTEKSLLPVRSGKGIFGHGLGFLFGRTFGRPFKKLAAALIPLSFQMGAASTWAVIAAMVGVKTLAIALVILKLLLLAGAAKVGSLFGYKGHESSGWEASHGHPQKEIHLHIHNGQGHEAITGSWNRDGVASPGESGSLNFVLDPYSGSTIHGPQTISTPYGNYVKVGSNPVSHHSLGSAFL